MIQIEYRLVSVIAWGIGGSCLCEPLAESDGLCSSLLSVMQVS